MIFGWKSKNLGHSVLCLLGHTEPLRAWKMEFFVLFECEHFCLDNRTKLNENHENKMNVKYVNEMNVKYVQHELVWMSFLYKLCKTIVYMSKPIHEVTQKVLAYSASDNQHGNTVFSAIYDWFENFLFTLHEPL